MKTKAIEHDTQTLILAVKCGMLTHACTKALEILTDPDADQFQAEKVVSLLQMALKDSR